MEERLGSIEQRRRQEDQETRQFVKESIQSANSGLVSRVGKIEQSMQESDMKAGQQTQNLQDLQ